jgi:hypothetical protein
MATKDPRKFKIIKLTKSHTHSPVKISEYQTKLNKSHGESSQLVKKTSIRIEELKLITSELKERENKFRRTSKNLKNKKEYLKQKIIQTDNEISSLSKLLELKYEDFLMQTIETSEDEDILIIINKLNLLREGLQKKCEKVKNKENDINERKKQLEESLLLLNENSLKQYNEIKEIMKINSHENIKSSPICLDLENLPSLVIQSVNNKRGFKIKSLSVPKYSIVNKDVYDSKLLNKFNPDYMSKNLSKISTELSYLRQNSNYSGKTNKTNEIYLKPSRPHNSSKLMINTSMNKKLDKSNTSLESANNCITISSAGQNYRKKSIIAKSNRVNIKKINNLSFNF